MIARLDLSTGITHPDSEGPASTAAHLARARQLAPNNPDYQKLPPN